MTTFAAYKEVLIDNLNRLEHLEGPLEAALNLLVKSPRPLFTCGVGKSSYIAKKMAASLQSLGLPTVFLHPCEAMHGDMGMVHPEGCMVILSKSGNSSEINQIIPVLKRRNVKIIAICNVEESPLGQNADVFIPIGCEKEGDVTNLLPLVSTEITLSICNYLSLRMGELTEFTKEKFAMNHPNGQIGFNLNNRVSDIPAWKRRKPFVRPDQTLMDTLMTSTEYRTGLVCVISENGQMSGILTDGDVRRALTEGLDPSNGHVAKIMNAQPITLNVTDLVGDALARMQSQGKNISSAPVIDENGNCGGVLLLHDIVGN